MHLPLPPHHFHPPPTVGLVPLITGVVCSHTCNWVRTHTYVEATTPPTSVPPPTSPHTCHTPLSPLQHGHTFLHFLYCAYLPGPLLLFDSFLSLCRSLGRTEGGGGGTPAPLGKQQAPAFLLGTCLAGIHAARQPTILVLILSLRTARVASRARCVHGCVFDAFGRLQAHAAHSRTLHGRRTAVFSPATCRLQPGGPGLRPLSASTPITCLPTAAHGLSPPCLSIAAFLGTLIALPHLITGSCLRHTSLHHSLGTCHGCCWETASPAYFWDMDDLECLQPN